jgi:hypothetical protein
MKIKTSELQGAALDWAVAKCLLPEGWDTAEIILGGDTDYSTDWSQGGPIIEREKIDVWTHAGKEWAASVDKGRNEFRGSTFLIAAMRCYVASKLSDEVEIPEALVC